MLYRYGNATYTGFEGYGTMAFRYDNDENFQIVSVYVDVKYEKVQNEGAMTLYTFKAPTVTFTYGRETFTGEIYKANLIL